MLAGFGGLSASRWTFTSMVGILAIIPYPATEVWRLSPRQMKKPRCRVASEARGKWRSECLYQISKVTASFLISDPLDASYSQDCGIDVVKVLHDGHERLEYRFYVG